MKRIVIKKLVLLSIMILFLAGCSTTATKAPKQKRSTPLLGWITLPSLPSFEPAKKVGGYFEDDGPPEYEINLEAIENAEPKPEPFSKYGNPASYSVNGTNYKVMKSNKNYKVQGLASWYGKKWHGKRTSSGEPYDIKKMTAAHPTLPLPTYAKVTNLDNGKQVVVKINDRGPFKSNRVLDLSYAAASKLGIVAKGTGNVLVEAIDTSSKLIKVAKESIAKEMKRESDAMEHQYLQLGSFSLRENALALVKQVEKLTDKPVQVNAVELAEKAFYQVKVGPFNSPQELEKAKTTVAAAGVGQSVLAKAETTTTAVKKETLPPNTAKQLETQLSAGIAETKTAVVTQSEIATPIVA